MSRPTENVIFTSFNSHQIGGSISIKSSFARKCLGLQRKVILPIPTPMGIGSIFRNITSMSQGMDRDQFAQVLHPMWWG